MRRTLLALLFAATPAMAQDCTPTSATDATALARRWHEDAPTPAALADILDAAVTHHAAGGDPDTVGPADATAAVQALLTAFPDLAISIDDTVTEDDTVVVRYTATGTQTGPFGDLAPSDRSATWTGIDIFRIACGRIAEIWSEVDAQSRLRQLMGDMP